MSRLEARLDDWTTQAVPGAAPAGLEPVARALLEEAERRLPDGRVPAALWHRVLDATRRPAYLQALGAADARYRWAEAAFAAIRVSRYSLGVMLAQRVAEHPGRSLFVESPEDGAPRWSYEAVARRRSRSSPRTASTPPARTSRASCTASRSRRSTPTPSRTASAPSSTG